MKSVVKTPWAKISFAVFLVFECLVLFGVCATATVLEIKEGTEIIPRKKYYKKNIVSVSIPPTVTAIGESAFEENAITSLSLPGSIVSIGERAFYGNAITSLSLPESITSIGESAFAYNAITSLSLPESITSIGESAFFSNDISALDIPPLISTISSDAFSGNKIEKLFIPPSVRHIEAMAFAANNISELIISEGVETIGKRAFADNDIAALDIPPLISTISGGAFSGNKIEKLFIPPSVRHIEANAFSNNDISELIISEGVETIDKNAFADNPSLTTVNISETVTSLASDAFDFRTTLTGKEQFRRGPSCRINCVDLFDKYSRKPNLVMKIDGKQVTVDDVVLLRRDYVEETSYFVTLSKHADVIQFTPSDGHDTLLTFDINVTRTDWTNIPIKYKFIPGHEYDFIFEAYNLTFIGDKGEMLEFIVFDKTTNRGTYWHYAWRDGLASALEVILNAQQLRGVYQNGNGFEIGSCKKDEQGNYVTLSDAKFRGKAPRF
jgi:hypothetical protein